MALLYKEVLQLLLLFSFPVYRVLSLVTVTGSFHYALPGQPYTLVCSVPDKTPLVYFRRTPVPPSTSPTQIGAVQVAGRGCYNIVVSPAVLCDPDVCSCISDGAGKASEFSWTFSPTNTMDKSTWYCVDFNNNESPTLTIRLAVPVTSVVLQNPPTPGYDLTITEGTSVSLVCVTSASRPSADVFWYIGETNLTSSSNQIVSDETGNLHITTSILIFNPDRNMNGERINCSAHNYPDISVTADDRPRLNVQYPSENTTTMNVSSVSITEGQYVSILSEVKGGNPKAKLIWSCFGGKTTDVSTETDSRSMITILGSRSQDGQLCTCRGQHSLVTITPAQVTFNIGYMSPLTLIGSSQYAIPGQPYTLTCGISDKTPLAYFRRKPVPPSTLPTQIGAVQVVGNGCYNIGLSTPVVCEISVCSCVSDGAGKASQFSWTFTPDNSMDQSTWYCVDFINNESPLLTLRFAVPVTSVALQNPPVLGSDLTVSEGISAKLVCVTSACRPSASVLWYIGKVNYSSFSNQVVSDEPESLHITTSTLIFTPDRNMNGEKINCSAYNYKDTTITANGLPSLNVQYGAGQSIVFNPESKNYTVAENTTLQPIVCSASCNPVCDIIWDKVGGESLKNPLTLGSISKEKAGLYICRASNLIKSINKPLSIKIKETTEVNYSSSNTECIVLLALPAFVLGNSLGVFS